MHLRALLVPCLLAGCAGVAPSKARYDLKIIHARVVDGTGAPWFRADVGIRGDEIAFVGDLSDASAARVIDAKDQILSPGFIDLLGQSENAVFVDPRLESKVRQGVTTEITGEGRTSAPLDEAMVKEDLEESPGSKPAAWRTLAQYLTALERNRSAINFGFFVGSANARQIAMGTVARDPTEAELQTMEQVVEGAMRDGAFGMSTSLIYPPAAYSKTEELIRLAKVSARHGGVYFTHLRSEGDSIFEALDEAFRIGREAQLPVNVWHLKIGGRHNWGKMPQIVDRLLEARAQGLDVAANVYPYVASSTVLTALLRPWALEGGYAGLLARLKDPVQRKRIYDEIAGSEASGFFTRVGGGDGVIVSDIPNPALKHLERKRLSEIARELGVDPVEAALRLYEACSSSPDAIYFSMNEDDMRHALRQPFVSVGADSGAVVGRRREKGVHPRGYGTFPRVIGRYARDEKLFSIEEAVRKVTSQAAGRLRLWDRGLVSPGKKADLVVFDPAEIIDRSTYEDPHQMSVGVSTVVVNGVPVLLDGALTGELPGRVLRGPGYRPP